MSDQGRTTTLLEDWRARRDRLAGGSRADEPYARLQVQILDYLIDRYRHSPEAARAARRPVRQALFVNDRAIVVNDHIWEGKVGGAKSRREAEARVSSILERMSATERDPVATGFEPPPAEPVPRATRRQRSLWKDAVAVIDAGGDARPEIEAALVANPYLPERIVDYLYQCLIDPEWEDDWAAELLARCENPSALTCAVLAWWKLHEEGMLDEVIDVLRDFFKRQELRDRVLPRICEQLAHESADVRLAAVELVGDVGGLEEVTLLSDLASLGPLDDEHPREREALVEAMQNIARKGEKNGP
ncbi:MAG: hypothetical protein ACYTG0_28775 [Planctomycetota bacterium]